MSIPQVKISLCVICGNEEAVIERFLDSFAPAFDEFSLVRAVGTQEPDKTETIARDWCAKHDKLCLFSEYMNAPDAPWPHVDDFAAARNQSYAQANGEWLMWADCDDLLHGADQLKPALERNHADADLLRFPYDVRGSFKRPFRERLLRASKFRDGRRWTWPVHENLLLHIGDRAMNLPAPLWVHAPPAAKKSQAKRNLTILSRAVSQAATHYYYVHQEHFFAGNQFSARRFGNMALGFPNLPESFRYQTEMQLGRIATTRDEAIEHVAKAHAVFPWAREAVVGLTLVALEKQDVRRAVFWASFMLSLDPPGDDHDWTHEPKWYGWAGWDLAAQAFRLGGHKEDLALCMKNLRPKRALFSLLHATRGKVRNQRAIHVRDIWLNTAARPETVQHIFAFDSNDDEPTKQLMSQFEHIENSGCSCVSAWNAAAAVAEGNVLIQLSDDYMPCVDWDLRLAEAFAGKDPLKDPFVIAVSDGHRKDDLLCMAICSRARYEQQTYTGECHGKVMDNFPSLFCPEYFGVYSDNEYSWRAFRDKIVIDARDKIVFQHDHPVFTGKPMDEIYNRQNDVERYREGWEIFCRRNPDAPRPPEPIGKTTDAWKRFSVNRDEQRLDWRDQPLIKT